MKQLLVICIHNITQSDLVMPMMNGFAKTLYNSLLPKKTVRCIHEVEDDRLVLMNP